MREDISLKADHPPSTLEPNDAPPLKNVTAYLHAVPIDRPPE
jgi:hypothetical protein